MDFKNNKVTLFSLVNFINHSFNLSIRHNDVMNIMPKLCKVDSFGEVENTTAKIITLKGKGEIKTISLNKEQAMVVAAHICNDYLIYVIRRLDFLERKHNEENTQDEMMAMVEHYDRILNGGGFKNESLIRNEDNLSIVMKCINGTYIIPIVNNNVRLTKATRI